jgi:hypothetical protein
LELVRRGFISPATNSETLSKQVARAKARWLHRVMTSDARSNAKVFAYFIFQHLNCVTLDAWPNQGTLRGHMHCSARTVARAADDLETTRLIVIDRPRRWGAVPRYVPAFAPEDWDKIVQPRGQICPTAMDRVVHRSSLENYLDESSPTGIRWKAIGESRQSWFKPAETGRWERELADALGPEGFEILDRLNTVDETIVPRLCRALCDGELGEREVEAARLAAAQLRGPT